MLPNLSNPVRAYMQRLTLVKISKEIVDYEEKEVQTVINTRGVRQPLDPQELEILQRGQRAWKWECLHVLPNADLKPDDVVLYKGARYRVKEKYDYSEYGYIEYLIAQTFEEDEESS
jgi:thiazole synthase ThiGH ThiG subunit